MTTDRLLREWQDMDRAEQQDVPPSTPSRRAVLYGVLGTVAILMLLLGLWLARSGNGDGNDVSSAVSSVAKAQPVSAAGVVATKSPATGQTGSQHGTHHGTSTGGGGGTAPGSGTARAGAGAGTGTGSADQASASSCGANRRGLLSSADVTGSDGVVAHGTVASSPDRAVTVKGVPYSVPVAVTYRTACR